MCMIRVDATSILVVAFMTIFVLSYFDSCGIVCNTVVIAALNKVCILFS